MNSPRRRARRSAKPTRAAEPKPAWATFAVVLGLIVVCLAVFTLDFTIRTLAFWLSRDDYVRTELEIKSIDSLGDNATVYGVVVATGEEVHVPRTPSELYEFDSPSDVTGTLMSSEKARGRLVPIWFAEDHDSSFESARVHFVSEFETPPSHSFVLGLAAMNLALFAVGVASVWAGIRLSRERKGDG